MQTRLKQLQSDVLEPLFELMKRMYLATTIFEDGQLTCSGVSSTPLLMRFQVVKKLPVFLFDGLKTHEYES